MPGDFESFLRSQPSPDAAVPGQTAPVSPAPGVDPTPAQPVAPFEAFLRANKSQQDAQQLQQAQGIAVANSGSSAAAAGQAAEVGRQIGAPQAAVEADLPRYQAQALAQKNSQTLAASPKLASWVAANPDSARVAQNDFDDMSQIEPLFSNDAKKSIEPVLMGLAKGAVGGFNDASLAVNRLIGYGAQGLDAVSGTNASDWWYQHMIAPALQNKDATAIPANAPFGVKAAGVGGNLLSMIATIAATGGAGAAAEAGEAATVGQAALQTAKTGSRAMAFPALTSAVNTGQDVYNQTGDSKQAIRAAQMAYATTTLGGIVPLGVPGSIGARLASGAASGAITGEVSRQAMNLVMPQQQGFDPEQTILSGLSGMMLGGLMGHGPLHEGVQQAFSDGLAAETAEHGGQAIEQLSKIAQESNLRTHDPQAFKEFVRSQTEDGNMPNVYVDGKIFEDALHQSSVDPQQIPGLQDRLAEATLTGGDVQIPVEDYATHIAGTNLENAILPNLKAEEGGMTYAEGQKFYQDAAGEMQARAQDIVSKQQGVEAQQDDVKAIGDKLMAQMQATGRFPDDVARASIAPVTEFYRTMAERYGMKPGELYEKYPLSIAKERTGNADKLDQATGWDSVETDEPGSVAADNPKGVYSPSQRTIGLLQNADLSTFLHESGHFFLHTMGDLAGREDAPQQAKDDMHTAIQWMGGKDLADWNSRSISQQRDMHEKWARGYETYLMEGKAPTQGMQALFSRFRSWLMNIYKSFNELHVQLTPEVRGVMDRMLASDEAIRQAEQSRGYFPLDLSKTGATDKQQADYAALGQQATQDAVGTLQARSVRDMQYTSNAKSRALKALQREAAGLRRGIQDEVTKEVMAQPVERAREFMKSGKVLDAEGREAPDMRPLGAGDGKINIADLKEMYPEGNLNRPDLDALRGMTSKTGMHPDMIAEMFGLGSGDELVRSLADGEKPKEQIARLTDQRMLERHGELTDPAAMDAAANEAVHNETRAKFMATGLKLLTKSPVPARELARAATEAAETTIAAKRVGDLNPRQYEVAETKANKEALTLAPKDTAGAVEAQRQALLSNRLAAAARDAVAEVKKIVSSQGKYDKDSIRNKMDPDILDQIDALRERFDFRQKPPEGPTKQQVQLQAWVDSQKDLGYAPLQNADMLDPSVRMHYKDMTVEQLRGFNDTIRSMEAIARERKTVTIAGKKVDLAVVVNDLTAKMQAQANKFTTQQLVDRPRAGVDSNFSVALDRSAAFLRSASAELKPQQFKANQFDQHEIMGPFAKAIFGRVFDANYHKLDMLKALSNDFKAAGERLGPDWQKGLTDTVSNTRLLDADLTKEAGTPVYRRLTRGDMLGIARHVGNESNFDKLTKGMEWQPNDVWSFLHDNMTAKDWEATQQTWDAFEKHWPEMVEMNKRLGNTSPDHIERRPFRTATGQDMQGGYAPLDYDPIRSKLAVRKSDSSAIDPAEGLFGKGYFRADTTTNGSLNGRVANYYDRLDLDFHSIERRLHDTVHDLAYREALLDVHKILTNGDFRRQFQLSYGPEQYKSMQQWVGDLANGQNRDQQLSRIGAILSSSRRAIVANGIALRISTALKHGGSAAFKSLGYFSGGGEKYFGARMAAIGTSPSREIAGAVAKFPEIRARLMQQDRDYRQMTASMFQPEGLHARAERFGHSMVAGLDMMTAVPTAWAAYDRAISEGIPINRGGTGQPMSEADAVAYANQIVREAHGSNIESSRSMVLQNKDNAVKMMTTLYGFMNNTLGQNMDMASKLRTAGFSKPEVLSRYMMAMIVPALWAGALESHHGDERWIKWAAGAITGEYAGMVPFAREAWSAIKGYPSAGVPAYMSAMGAIAKPAQDAYKLATGGQVKAPIKDLGNAAGLLIPGLGQIGTTLQYAADVHSGKEQPHGAVDVARGLTLGQSNKH